MPEQHLSFWIPASLMVLVLISGLILRRRGLPYHSGLVTFHKMSGLAAMIFITLIALRILDAKDYATLCFAIASFMALSFIIVFVSGALLSIKNKQAPKLVVIHILSTFALVIAALIFFMI